MPISHRRRLAAPAVLVAATLLLSACSAAASTTESTPESPVPGGTLRLSYSADTASCIDPNQVSFIENRGITRNFTDSLTDQDPETGEIVPWLATDWTVSDDATEFVFTLRDGVTFSDGTALDATAVKTAYDGIVALGAASYLGISYLAGYQSTEVVDDDTVKVTFATPNVSFLQATSTTTLGILSPATYAKTAEERCAGDLVGSGLFVLDSYVANTEAVLSRRDGYAWPSALVENQGESYLDGIQVSYVPEDSVRVGNLISGGTDLAWPRTPISEADQARIEAEGGTIESRSLPGNAQGYIPNVKNGGPLADVKVRGAITKAIDYDSYASTVFWDGYPVVSSAYDTSTPSYADNSELLAFDPEGAAELLDDAGWRVGDDGYRYKDGEKLTLVFPTTAAGIGDQLIQAQLKEVGIDLVLDVVTQAVATERLAAGDYDLTVRYQTRADPSVLASVLDQSISKAPIAQNSQDAATAAEVSRLFDEGFAAVESAERDTVYAELQSYLIEQGVVFPYQERVLYLARSEAVHGFALTSESMLRANDIWLSQS
ncbi:ABC transporter substrate-binding protein [Microbacteriaceae bacterium VKM Ac-2854]|nr:ABC transporter substrate-binding protein [Microbacteriaceae bacterium VKM Ac-2854]